MAYDLSRVELPSEFFNSEERQTARDMEVQPDETLCPDCHTVHAPHQKECW